MNQLEEPDLSKTYSYADYLKWTFEGMVELIKGKVFMMSPAPLSIHQVIAGNLHGYLWQYLKKKPCQVFIAPFDVRLLNKDKSTADKDIFTVVQPDICIICNPEQIDKRGCVGAPDMIAEVLSPGTSKKDIKDKYQVYEESGVKEYWIVAPQDQTLTIFDFDEYTGKYALRGLYSRENKVSVAVLPGFVLDLSEVFPEEEN